MNDRDRTIASIEAQTKGRILVDGCTACNGSTNYCRCVAYFDGPDARCCDFCSHN